MTDRNCRGGCGAELKTSKTGYCRKCFNRSPVKLAAQSATWERRMADPDLAAQARKSLARNAAKGLTDPETMERRRQLGRDQWRKMWTPEAREHWLATNAQMRRRLSDTKLAWCPQDYRDEYRRLRDQRIGNGRKRGSKAARALIEQRIADDRAIKSGALTDAAHWLNRLAPVSRLDDGRYRYGQAILTPGELIARARIKGWNDHDSLARVA
jgi:hypothetical protein